MRLNEVAAAVHKRMCDDDRFGYSWEERWGAKKEVWNVGGRKLSINVGDYDCSSSTITAWSIAFQGTKYANALANAQTTRNMRSVFVGSGLFEWKPMSFLAEPGDLYLSEQNHVAMCQTQFPDVLSEFSWGDNGAYGNRRGDQSGREAVVGSYYDYEPGGWDGILHYNGKAEPKGAAPAKPKVLYGIDVSSNQPERIVRDVPNDFAIVKMGGNPHEDGSGRPLSWNFVNPSAKQQSADAMKKHGRLGLYWFGYGKEARVEADFFIKQVKALGYLGRAMLVLDYEEDVLARGQTWVKKFCDRVAELAGYKPVIYASGGVITSQNLRSLGYPIWCANYYKGYEPIYGYDTTGCTIWRGCEDSVLWQYTSSGHLDGYDGPLDCNVFYGGDWARYAGPEGYRSGTYRIAVQTAKVRAQRSAKAKVVAPLKKGDKLRLVTLKRNADGSWWGRVEGGKYHGKFVCVELEGKRRAVRE